MVKSLSMVKTVKLNLEKEKRVAKLMELVKEGKIKLELAYSELDVALGLDTWLKDEARRRLSDKNFKFIKFDFLAMLMSERANIGFRKRYAEMNNVWRQVALREADTHESLLVPDRFLSLRKMFGRKGIKTELTNTSKNPETADWHLVADMKVPVELTLYAGMLRLRIPYRYNPYLANWTNDNWCLCGSISVPYTDEQLVQVLIMADNALPHVEKKVLDKVTNMLSSTAAKEIHDIRSYAAICGVMDESGLSYTARQTSRGIRVSIPVGERNVLSFRVRKNDEGFNAEMMREAAEAAEKLIRLLGPAAKLDRIGTIREPRL